MKTLVLLKPDAVERRLCGTLLGEFEANGFEILYMKVIEPDSTLLARHYEEHKKKSFFENLISHMSGKKMIACVLSHPNAIKRGREVVTSIRERYITNPLCGPRNLVHGSDSEASATREIRLWFTVTP